MFDWIEIIIKAGNGGAGAVSFRREKFVPFGGPDGGDGGAGGDVLLEADPGISTLNEFKPKKIYRAGNGESGKGRKKHGKSGADLTLRVPAGTVALERTGAEEKVVIADCEQDGQRAIIATGGEGGLGNVHFASSTNQAPKIAQKGEVGEEKSIILELRLIADVGIIGYPNVGKSTLLASATSAKPKVAGYPFTTREPILGVVEVGQRTFVLAEIPGLIDDAHLGRGLGHDFLRHITRTRVLIHLVDGSSASPVEDMVRVNTELTLFDAALAQKPQLVAINKVDLPQVQVQLDDIKKAFGDAGVSVRFVSADTGDGVSKLMTEAVKMLGEAAELKSKEQVPRKVFHPEPRVAAISVRKEGDAFIVVASALERIVARVDMTSPEVRWQIRKQMAKLGVSKALDKAGIGPGDKVRCGEFEWEW